MTVPGPSPTPPDNAAPDTPPPLDQIFAEVSPRSVGGTSLFSALPDDAVNQDTVQAFRSEPSDLREAITRLKGLGFVVHHPDASVITLTISGPPELYKQVFGVDFTTQQQQMTTLNDAVQPEADRDMGQSYLAPVGDHSEFYADPPASLADAIEGVVFPQPHEFHALSATPPTVDYFHLRLPDDVARLLRADLVHQQGITGSGVRVAMVDSGHYRHPFFIAQGYQIMPVLLAADAATTDPTRDDNGHGTMESANLFAVAPGITLIPVKSMLRDTAAAFKVALAQNPHIINCSWGLCMRQSVSRCSGGLLTTLPISERPLQAAIAEAVRRGIVVVFSAGNGHISWPAMHPDVIAAGGAYVDETGQVQASNYASSFISPIFPTRAVPDLVGLVGQLPGAIYIMSPGQPGCDIDMKNATRGPYPQGDNTAPDDGWAVISGTSAAAPQIAGVAALLLHATPGLTPDVVKNLLIRSGRDVAAGATNPTCEDAPPGPHQATPGPDLATGSGLVDAYRVYSMARLHQFLTPSPAAAGVGGGTPTPVLLTPPAPGPTPIGQGITPAPAPEDVPTVPTPIAQPPTPTITFRTGAAEVRVQLTIRVEVTGVEVTAVAGGTEPGAGGLAAGVVNEAAPAGDVAPVPGPAAPPASAPTSTVSIDAAFLQALKEDPALRQLLLDALDSAPPSVAGMTPPTPPAPPATPTPPSPPAEEHL